MNVTVDGGKRQSRSPGAAPATGSADSSRRFALEAASARKADLPARDSSRVSAAASGSPDAAPLTARNLSEIPIFSSSHEDVAEALRGAGTPLGESARGLFEARFSRDLRAVRIHRGPAAGAAAHVLRARAFTVGSDIAWPDWVPAPDSPGARSLLTHELTHVVQQQSGTTSAGGIGAEREARAAAALPTGEPIQTSPTRPGVACAPGDWLGTSHDLRTLSYSQLVAELEEIKRWLRNRSQSTPDVLRYEQVRDELLTEIDRRDSRARSSAEEGAPTPSVPKPRMLAKKGSVVFRDEDEMRREVSHMEVWLARGGLSEQDRAMVQLELNAVQPLAATIDHFTFDGWHVPNGQMAKMMPLARRIAAAPRVPVRVVGHTDPVGTHEYNVDLGRKRANEVTRLLKAALRQVAPGRVFDAFDVFSHGEREPVASNDTERGRERNRRVEVFVPVTGPWLADPADLQSPDRKGRKNQRQKDNRGDDNGPVATPWTVVDPPLPFNPLDVISQNEVPPDLPGDRSGHSILTLLKAAAVPLGVTLSSGLSAIGEAALGEAIGAILAAFEEAGIGTAGIGLAGERAAEVILEHEFGDRNAVFNLNALQKNFPLLDLMTPHQLPSVKTLGILTDQPYESNRAKIMQALRQGIGLNLPGDTGKLERAAKALLRHRAELLRQAKGAVPEAIRMARTADQMKDAIRDLYTLHIPDDWVSRAREDAAQMLFDSLRVAIDVPGHKHLAGRAATAADAKWVQEIASKIRPIGISSPDFKVMLEVAKEEFRGRGKKPR